MKKLILFLLLPLWAMAQTSTGQEQEFDYGIKNNSTQTITTPPYLTTTGMDGTQGKIPSALIEKTDNKQNSLAVDGTGVKYPTVDAVFDALASKANIGNAFTAGRVPYTSSASSISDSSKLLWNNTNSYFEVNGNAPRFTLKNNINNYSTYFTNNANGTLILKNHQDKTLAVFNNPVWSTDQPQMAIGKVSSIPVESQLYVYGGMNGANIDARGSIDRDEANIDLEGNDWETSPNSLGFSYFGSNSTAFGTMLGYPKNKLGIIRFQDTNYAIINSEKIGGISPIRFGINDIEIGNVNDKGFSYQSDFSSENISNPRWLTDKGYVDTKVSLSEKGATNGVATLGSDGKVPNSQIPALTTANISDSAEKRYQTDNQKLFNDATSSIQTQLNGKENAFSKNTAFNKNFGTTAGTVAEGNHLHSFSDLQNNPTTIAGYGITDANKSPINVNVTTVRTTAAKIGTTSSGTYSPSIGDRIDVTFTLGTAIANATLNIDGSGVKAIQLAGTNVTALSLSTPASLVVIPMYYNGTAWQIYGSTMSADTNTTYIEATTGLVVTNSNQVVAVNTLYYANNASNVAFTLPTTCAVNSIVHIVGMNSTGTYSVIAPSGDNIILEGNDTGVGGILNGSIRSTLVLRCTVANTTWSVVNYTGQIVSNTGYSTNKESTVNKSDSYSVSSTVTYPNTKALVEGLDTKAPVSGSANYIQNQNDSAQTANMWINGSIKAGAATFASTVTARAFISNDSNNGYNIDINKTAGFGSSLSIKNSSSLSNSLVRLFKPNNIDFYNLYTSSTGIELDGTISATGGTTANQVVIKSQLDAKADLASPSFTGTPTAPTAAPGTTGNQIATLDYVLANSGARPYKVYTALLSQTGTNAPTATVLENTLGTVTFTRSSNGVYLVNSSGLFTADKTFVIMGAGTNATYTNAINLMNSSTFSIVTKVSSTQSDADSANTKVAFEIRVYN